MFTKRLSVICSALALAACAAPDYQWSVETMPTPNIHWEKADAISVMHFCGFKDEYVNRVSSCAIQIPQSKSCYVYSTYSEAHAKLVIAADGISLYEHEWKHCQGLKHFPQILGER